ncbi:glycosyl hydrolase [Arthrobacter sp. CDRTa11]|uniref:glycosyl hydrolase n=1 Tax=Arthrobacter sp. CDRTa11 TaxID=2651199 RepID=UPI002265B016|nr:glycosyl hydrolase [Arthrobacter sp. CDRTa11]
MSLAKKWVALAIAYVLAVSAAGCSAVPNDEGAQKTPAATPSASSPSTGGTRPVPRTEPAGAANEFQTMSGLGVNANVHSWNNGELKPAIDKIADLGEVTWRVIIDKADWETEEVPGGTETIDWALYSSIYERGKMADLWDTIEYINSKPDQQVMINVMGGVPGWMGGNRIDESREDHWVRMIASMVAYGREVRGLDFKLLGPMNETDWNGIEGPQVGPEQYVRLLHKLIVRLDGLGFSDIRLAAPDTASAAKAVSEYLPVLAQDPLVMSRLAHIAIHSYDGDSAGMESALRRAANPGPDFWVTEFSGPCPGCDAGSPNPMDWSSAAATAADALNLLEQGAAGLQQYDAWDGYYEHHESMGYWGLLGYDQGTGKYTPRKTYYVMQQLIRHTPRNAVRIAASSADEGIQVVAFRDQTTGRITFFGNNTSDRPVEARLDTPGISQDVQLASYATDATRDMESGEPAVLADGSVTYTAAAGSVFTLTGIPSKG